MRINKINREEYHDQHLLIHKDLNNDFKEAISKYNSFGIDKTTKSELIRLFIKDFITEFNNSGDDFKYELLKSLKNFRDAGAGTPANDV